MTGGSVCWEQDIEGFSDVEALKDRSKTFEIFFTCNFVLLVLSLSKSDLVWVVHSGHRENVSFCDVQVDRYAAIIVKSTELAYFISTCEASHKFSVFWLSA